MKINTVNVIEIVEGTIIQVKSWPPANVKEAEEFFIAVCSENGPNWSDYSEEDINDIVSDGFFALDEWSVSLVHSS